MNLDRAIEITKERYENAYKNWNEKDGISREIYHAYQDAYFKSLILLQEIKNEG